MALDNKVFSSATSNGGDSPKIISVFTEYTTIDVVGKEIVCRMNRSKLSFKITVLEEPRHKIGRKYYHEEKNPLTAAMEQITAGMGAASLGAKLKLRLVLLLMITSNLDFIYFPFRFFLITLAEFFSGTGSSSTDYYSCSGTSSGSTDYYSCSGASSSSGTCGSYCNCSAHMFLCLQLPMAKQLQMMQL